MAKMSVIYKIYITHAHTITRSDNASSVFELQMYKQNDNINIERERGGGGGGNV